MREESPEAKRPLRSGYTTGACATATSLAAARLLLEGLVTKTCTITLPRGQHVEFSLTDCHLQSPRVAFASTIKDAGDDPDVTHGATVFAEVALHDEAGVSFYAAPGVGTVTRDGLSINKGEAAINPVPRQMMRSHLEQLAQSCHYKGGFKVHIGIKNGEQIATKTMNPRLGIVGGLSILGTTGIVRPFSCSAYIASIQQGIDVAYKNGLQHIAACTGSTSEARAQKEYQLPEMGLIEMGDFVGAVLKHIKHAPVAKLSLIGGFGKFSKLANGHMDLHSRSSSIDLDELASKAVIAGANSELCEQIKQANTSLQALKLCQQHNVPLGNIVCEQARAVAAAVIPTSVAVEVWAVNKQGDVVGHADWCHGKRPRRLKG
ncbi:cobalt-precorrin-5B (C(1))-methyltransferase [Alkalimarinus sediminis]|uniref:Cobalt-precorrin-5B C(1)-methyltransferase n=1 Tax=Alkalimarinus sediminis TaxID=1632866 RepID=A0A9E8HLC8_9ALTE|nr:cobalt-precorrin-5B (C(1))-methyltransferase [Alkalimarinus sediminis]UZW74986.1 cobalt-precorrin-5B (C(1))-methyltransferase [Alkalimarinus sediminis]